ncbi:MAG: GtrA family protein [Acetivibrionales bacterium]|jgi:putative flippase GtrA
MKNRGPADNTAPGRPGNTKHFEFLDSESAGQMIRYVITGLSSATIEFTLLYVFKDMAGLPVIAANSAALSIVFWFNFLMNRYWSFKSRMKIQKQLVMYLFLFLFNLLASDVIMYLLVEKFSIQYLVAKVFAIGVMVCWNFVLYKKVIYKK